MTFEIVDRSIYGAIFLNALLILSCNGHPQKQKVPFKQNVLLNQEILLSPLADVDVIEGTRIKVFLSAIDDNLSNMSFTCQDCPPFIVLSKTTNGACTITIDGVADERRDFAIKIRAKNGDKSGIARLNINIIKHHGPIYTCMPNSDSETEAGATSAPLANLEQVMGSDFTPDSNALILLTSGFHGAPVVTSGNITIAAAAGNEPHLSAIRFKNVSHVVLNGLTIGAHYAVHFAPKKYMVLVDSASSHITIQNCNIRTTATTTDWTTTDWGAKAGNGIKCQATDCKIQNNLIQNVFHGIKTENQNTQVSYNTVDRFSGDAIRNTASNNSYSFNLLKNAIIDDYDDPAGNHDDLFQSWTFGASLKNIQIKYNIALSYVEPDLPLKSRVVQGIACFDGFEKDWLIENNLVITDHPHGIALYGAEDCTIIGNTVLRHPGRLFQFESDPWIMINNHKDGRESVNCKIVNNVTTALNIVSHDVIEKNNIIIESGFSDYFEDYPGWDFRKKLNE